MLNEELDDAFLYPQKVPRDQMLCLSQLAVFCTQCFPHSRRGRLVRVLGTQTELMTRYNLVNFIGMLRRPNLDRAGSANEIVSVQHKYLLQLLATIPKVHLYHDGFVDWLAGESVFRCDLEVPIAIVNDDVKLVGVAEWS